MAGDEEPEPEERPAGDEPGPEVTAGDEPEPENREQMAADPEQARE